MEQKWKSWSFNKKVVVGLVVAVIGFNLMVNLQFFTVIINRFLGVMTPFIIGVAIAYLLAKPIEKMKKLYDKRKSKFVKKRAHTLAVWILF